LEKKIFLARFFQDESMHMVLSFTLIGTLVQPSVQLSGNASSPIFGILGQFEAIFVLCKVCTHKDSATDLNYWPPSLRDKIYIFHGEMYDKGSRNALRVVFNSTKTYSGFHKVVASLFHYHVVKVADELGLNNVAIIEHDAVISLDPRQQMWNLDQILVNIQHQTIFDDAEEMEWEILRFGAQYR